MENARYKIISKKTKESATVEIVGEISSDVLEFCYESAFETARKNFEFPGFRKGNVPANIVEKEIPSSYLLEEAAHIALSEIYPELVKNESIESLSSPRVSVTKLARENPIGFAISVGIVPKIKLPKYKKMGRDVFGDALKITVEREEVDRTIEQILTMRKAASENTPDKISKASDVTDEFVATLGDFKNVSDFKKKIKEDLLEEKKTAEMRKKREELAKRLVEESSPEISPLIIEDELTILKHKLNKNLEENKINKEDYFSSIGKSEKDFWDEQQKHIERQIKTKLILQAIAKEESLFPSEEDIKKESELILSRAPSLDPKNVKNYVLEALTNENVLSFLETHCE